MGTDSSTFIRAADLALIKMEEPGSIKSLTLFEDKDLFDTWQVTWETFLEILKSFAVKSLKSKSWRTIPDYPYSWYQITASKSGRRQAKWLLCRHRGGGHQGVCHIYANRRRQEVNCPILQTLESLCKKWRYHSVFDLDMDESMLKWLGLMPVLYSVRY